MKSIKIYLSLFISILCLSFNVAYSDVPITTDSRIKTYIYNENEVFLLVVHYGYQSSIEFGIGEEIETISVGDSYAWKISPLGRRLFIKPFEENMHTNMTVITNKRTYQFDVVSKTSDDEYDKDLVYVVRFFYPAKENNAQADSLSDLESYEDEQ